MALGHGEPRQGNVSTGPDGGGFIGNRSDRTGAQFTVGWKEALVMEGRVFQITVGTVAAGIVGGGAGTVIDLDQPEFGVSIAANMTLIPLEIYIAADTALDADDEVAQIQVVADESAAYAGDGTVTDEVALNNIRGDGVSSVATAFSAATADITDPVISRIIAAKSWSVMAMEVTETGAAAIGMNLHYVADIPIFLRGPAAFYGYWGATGAATGVASVVWAEIPSSRININS